MRKMIAAWMCAASFCVCGPALAFSQDVGGTWYGHEKITVLGAKLAKGATAEPAKNEVPCAVTLCDTYGTNNFKTYSAVLGERYTDFGGYAVVGSALVVQDARSHTCLDATMQNSDVAQAWHALRRKCDVGGQGLRNTHAIYLKWLKDMFLFSVKQPSTTIEVHDGGGTLAMRKVDRRYFTFGIVVHGVQDSFSTEHTVRSSDWKKISDFKTYVGTASALPHRHDMPTQPAHGDFIYTQGGRFDKAKNLTLGVDSFKLSAKAAALATEDLFKTFERALKSPPSASTEFDGFAKRMLQLDPSSEALNNPAKNTVDCAPDPAIEKTRKACCAPDPAVEKMRKACLAAAGTDLGGLFPRFGRSKAKP